jgi:cellobiose epimerase
MRIPILLSAVLLVCLSPASGGQQPAAPAAPAPRATPETYRRLADEVETNLRREILDKWFPAAVDRDAGGFYENYKEDWTRGPTGEKNIVYQSRLTWLAAQASRRFPERSAEYLAITRHGAAVLADKLWDKDKGGFFWAVTDAGRPARDRGDEKHVYGISFGIYAAAASHAVTKDPASLDLAKRGFRWLEEHAHDPKNGGYYEALTAAGTPILDGTPDRPSDAIGTKYGRKSMNTHIHLLEAFVGLQEVWPDPAVRTRLAELHEILLTKIYTEPGAQHMFTTPDWQAVPGHDSFGHDIETAFLLAESAEALGKPEDARTWHAARRLVDHALEVGYDHEHGGFYDEGTVKGEDLAKQKIWWVEAEGLNALLLMHERFGRETPRYWDAFVQTWNFIARHQVDPKFGGWYSTVKPDGAPIPGRAKSDRWTEGYHQGRSMLTVSARLRELADPKPRPASKHEANGPK